MSVYAEHAGYTKEAARLRKEAATAKGAGRDRLLALAVRAEEFAAESWHDCQQEARAEAHYDEHGGLSDDCEEDDDDE